LKKVEKSFAINLKTYILVFSF